ncbi:g3976 [Coccomyxa elongata]
MSFAQYAPPPHRPVQPSAGLPPPPVLPTEPEIDREKVCPMLIRVFPQFGGHHRLEDYARRGQEPKDEVQMYTWPDATLRELTDLVKEVQPAARRSTARLEFALVYPDKRGRNVMRVVGGTHSTRPGPDDNKTLKQLNFQTGDFLDVSIV